MAAVANVVWISALILGSLSWATTKAPSSDGETPSTRASVAEPARETSFVVSLDAESGVGFSSLNLALDASRGRARPNEIWLSRYGVYAGGTQSKSEDATTNQSTTYRSQDVGGSLGVNLGPAWSLTGSLFSTRTPETSYAQAGGGIDLAFTWRASVDETVGFSPYLSLSVGRSSSNIRQSFQFTVLGFTSGRDLELQQQSTSIGFSAMPAEWINLGVSLTRTTYDRPTEELRAAFNNRFLVGSASSVVSTIGGLPESNLSGNLGFYFLDDWELEILRSTTRLLIDGSANHMTQLTGYYNWGDWRFGLGAARNETATNRTNSALGHLSYMF